MSLGIPTKLAPLRYSSDDVPQRMRLERLNDAFGAGDFPCEIVGSTEAPARMTARILALPDLIVTDGVSRGVAFRRTRRHAVANDLLTLTMPLHGRYRVVQREQHFQVLPGQCWAAVADESTLATGAAECSRESLAFMLPRHALVDARLDLAHLLRGPIRCEATVLALLRAYVCGVLSTDSGLSSALGEHAAEHIMDLMLLALGARDAAADHAHVRSLPMARLYQLKQDIQRTVDTGAPLGLAELAARQCISPVYVQKLFERDGTSFSAYVLERRLACVHRRLRHPRHAHRSISHLAFDAGFNNLSWFNRAFRKRYGATPSEVRAGR